jgi:cyclase
VIWTRRQFLVTSSAAAAASVVRLPLVAQQAAPAQGQPSAPQTAFTPLRRNVGIFTGSGGTIGWLVSKDAVIVVDTQMPPTASICLDGIKERSGGRKIDLVINTHHHGDHTGGNAVFRPAAKKILAHARVPELQKAAAQPAAQASQVYADATYTSTWVEKYGDETVHLVYFGPAHTGGDSVVFFEKANVIHMGDLVFQHRLPFADRPGGCSIQGWMPLLEKVATLHGADTLYIFGHAKQGMAETGKKEDLLYQRDFLAALLDHVRAQVKAGKSRDEIVKTAVELKGFPDHGALSERLLTVAYEELSAT